MTGLECRPVLFEGSRATGVMARTSAGREVEITANVVGLAANAILIRSNIIAVVRGQKTAFEYHNVDPYDPECGSFLSARAEEPQA